MTRALLQLFDRALVDHARHVEAGELQVITCVAPDVAREPHIALIREMTRHAGGLFFEASQMWEGVRERGDAILEQVLETLGAPHPVIELERVGADELVRARYVEVPTPRRTSRHEPFWASQTRSSTAAS